MFIFLSKFLPLFVYPIGLVSLLIIAALIFIKRQKLARLFLIIAFLILFVAGNKYFANLLVKSLEWQYETFESAPEVDAIVVLGGGTEPNLAPRPMAEINNAGDRILYGASLYRQYPEAKVLLSGGDIDFLAQSTGVPAQDMAELMQLMGVPETSMILQDQSQNTYEDALYSCKIIKEAGYQNVLLVTSALHMPRSVKLFEKQGCKVIPAPTDFGITQTAWEKLWSPSFEEFIINLVPNYSNLSSVTKAFKEYLGMFAYHLKGWL